MLGHQPGAPGSLCIPTWTRVDRRGGGVKWSSWLTLADLDGGGVPDSDPGGILGSISEPSPGVISITVNPDGTKRDGIAEGVAFLSSFAKGWWGAAPQIWPTDGTGRIICHVRLVSNSSGTGTPFGVLFVTTVEGLNVATGNGVGGGPVNFAPYVASGAGGSALTSGTFTEFFGTHNLNACVIPTAGRRNGTQAYAMAIYSDGTWRTSNTGGLGGGNGPLQTDLADPTRMQLGIAFGNGLATAVPYTLVARFRYAIITAPSPI